MQKGTMTINKGLREMETISEGTSALSKFFRGKLSKMLFVVGSVGAVIGINETIKNSDIEADKLFFSGQNLSFTTPVGVGEPGQASQSSNGMNNSNFESSVTGKSDNENDKKISDESNLSKEETKEAVKVEDNKEKQVSSSAIELVSEIVTKDMIISIQNKHLRIILQKEARKLVLENEDFDEYDGAFVAVIPTTGVGLGYNGTFDPEGINYIPLRQIFENNNGDGEVLINVSNGENNNNLFVKVNIRGEKIVVGGGDLVVNNSKLPDIVER